MKIKQSELYFYELLRDFLHKYLIVQRKFTDATVKNYTDSLGQYRQYLRSQKNIPFDKVGFHCFTKEMVYERYLMLKNAFESISDKEPECLKRINRYYQVLMSDNNKYLIENENQ